MHLPNLISSHPSLTLPSCTTCQSNVSPPQTRLAEKVLRPIRNSDKHSSLPQLQTRDSRSNGLQIHVRSLGEDAVTKHEPVEGWVEGEKDTTTASSRVYEPTRLPIYGRAMRRANWRDNQDVNMNMMVISRILIPAIFIIFNCCYWGVALTYVQYSILLHSITITVLYRSPWLSMVCYLIFSLSESLG